MVLVDYIKVVIGANYDTGECEHGWAWVGMALETGEVVIQQRPNQTFDQFIRAIVELFGPDQYQLCDAAILLMCITYPVPKAFAEIQPFQHNFNMWVNRYIQGYSFEYET